MIPDPFEKTVLLPVKFVEGKPKFFYGGDLPVMKNGTIGELKIPEYCIPNDYRLDLIRRESKKEFLPEGTTLMARLSLRSNDPTKEFLKRLEVSPPINGLFATIELKSQLCINLKGTKKPELLDCECKIPALPNEDPKSINHAFTLLSEKFETHRRSHTASVFEQVYYQIKTNNWVRLKERRDQLIGEYEYELICLCKSWWFKNYQSGPVLWACGDKKSSDNIIVYGIDQDAKVLSENYFKSEIDSADWLKQNGYHKFTNNEAEEGLMPPAPPYKKPDEILKLTGIKNQ